MATLGVGQHLLLLFFYFTLGFVFQFPEQTVRMHIIESFHVSPAYLSFVYGFVSIPWFFKPCYGFFSDTVPFCGYRRRSYISLSSFLCGMCWITMAHSLESFTTIMSMLVASSFCLCISDVITDGMLVEYVKDEDEDRGGRLQSHVWAARAAGGLCASLAGPYVKVNVGIAWVFGLTAVCPLINSAAVWCLREHDATAQLERTLRQTCVDLWQAYKTPRILRMATFVFISGIMPSYYMSLVYYLQTQRHFSAVTFGYLDMTYNLSLLCGALAFSVCCRRWNFRVILAICLVLQFLLRMAQLLLIFHINTRWDIPDVVFVAMESVAFSLVGSIANMPIVILGAQLCPKGLESTFYASLMSISNVAGALSSWCGAALTAYFHVTHGSFDNLWKLVIVCNILGVLPILLVCQVPSSGEVRGDHERIPLADPAYVTTEMVSLQQPNPSAPPATFLEEFESHFNPDTEKAPDVS